MVVIESNEEVLRSLVIDHNYLIAFYHRPTCLICNELFPAFKEYSKPYSAITFVSIDTGENSIPGRLVDKREVPFISIYKNGLLLECKNISNKNELLHSLNQLFNSKVSDTK